MIRIICYRATTGRRDTRAGFTLLEALLAILILSLILIGAAPAMAHAVGVTERAATKRRAVEIASEYAEEYLHRGYDQMTDQTESVDLGDATGTATVDVQNVASSASGVGYNQVTVTVDWNTQDYDDSVTLTTYVSSAAARR